MSYAEADVEIKEGTSRLNLKFGPATVPPSRSASPDDIHVQQPEWVLLNMRNTGNLAWQVHSALSLQFEQQDANH